MKLTVKILDAEAVAGGKAVLLCDEHGAPLPMQIRSTLDCRAGDLPSLTVEFHVDGETVRID